MINKWLYIGCFSAVLLGLTCCKRVKPQGAANQTGQDSSALALMQMHARQSLEEKLFLQALDADKQLTDSVRSSGLPYVLDQSGTWYYRLTSAEGQEVKPDMHVDYSATIRDLETGELLEDIAEEVQVGKRQTLRAIDIILPLMRTGETFLLLAPYYNAYGRDGSEQVPPLTNVSIMLTVNNITKI